MKKISILIFTHAKIFKVKNKYYTDNGFAKILERYAKNFEVVKICTRIIETSEVGNGFINISNLNLSYINNESNFKFFVIGLSNVVKQEIDSVDLVVLRMPSIRSMKIYRYLRRKKKKYLTEVMGCVWDSFFHHGIIGKIIAPYCFFYTKRIIYNANYCTYVTQKFLQTRYPCKNKSVGVSNVNIDKISSVKNYKNFDDKNFSIMTSAAVNVKYKGQAYVIKAIKVLKNQGYNIKYYLAGKGNNQYLKSMVEKYDLTDNVIFLGMLSHNEILQKLKDIDIYIQPSLHEGLPRSLIEAMSCGCVCLASNIAGNPELLNDDKLFNKGNVNAIVNSLKNIIKKKDLFKDFSESNLNTASLYLNSILDMRRKKYYDYVKQDLYKED